MSHRDLLALFAIDLEANNAGEVLPDVVNEHSGLWIRAALCGDKFLLTDTAVWVCLDRDIGDFGQLRRFPASRVEPRHRPRTKVFVVVDACAHQHVSVFDRACTGHPCSIGCHHLHTTIGVFDAQLCT